VKFLAALMAAMSVVLVVAILAYADVIDLPGHWRSELGLSSETPDPPCHPGLYRRVTASPKPPPGHWREEPPAPKAQVEGSATAIGPILYTAGGARPGNLHTFLAYDTRSRHWSEPTRLPVGLNHTPLVPYRGDLYLPGGYAEGEAPTDAFWRYDPRTKRWTELAPMPQALGGAAAAVVGHRLYAVDGAPQTYFVEDPQQPYDELQVYDFERGTWSMGPKPPIAVHHATAAALGGRLYLVGGRTDPERATSAFHSFDPRSGRWQRLPDLPMGPTSTAGAVVADGKLVVYGGDDEVGWKDGNGSVIASAWAFDPRDGRWQRLPDMNLERQAFGAAVAGGRIFAVAGSYCPGLKPNGPVTTHTVESLSVDVVGGGLR
jgi:N-acetylneuraminic acid mutarotase